LVRGKPVAELYVAGEDKVFYPAEAQVRGDSIIARSGKVKRPVAVRYAFSNAAIGNIFSKEGLPLAPFRTDGWPARWQAVHWVSTMFARSSRTPAFPSTSWALGKCS